MSALELFIKWLVFSMCVWHELMSVLAQEQNITSTNISSEICVKHFDRGILKCMEPFIMASKSYTDAKLQGMDSEKILLKHLCFEYEKMLQCLHSSLANCPTLENIRKVQHKLGTNWVKTVNRLCIIQSDISKMKTNQTDDNAAILNKENGDISHPGNTNKHVLDNAITNQLPQNKNKVSYWKNLKMQRQTLKERLRYMYNTVELDTYSVMNYYQQRTGALTVTDKPSSSSGILMNTLIILTCLLVVHINY